MESDSLKDWTSCRIEDESCSSAPSFFARFPPCFRVSGFGSQVSGFGFRVLGFCFWLSGFGLRLWGLDYGVGGSGLGV